MTKEVFRNVTFDWLEDRTILLAKVGSFAYGTHTENSDIDYKGVCIPPVDYYLGLNTFKGYDNSGGKNFKNTKDDIDVNIMHINKFVSDAMKGVPNNIEILFTRKADILKITDLGQCLIDNRHMFLSKEIYKKFRGYAFSQIQSIKREVLKVGKTSHSNGIHDYNTKNFMHGVRLLTSAIEILETHDFSTYRSNREFLLKCRSGMYSVEEAIEILDSYDKRLTVAFEESTLKDKPDYEKINQLLISINKEAIGRTTLNEAKETKTEPMLWKTICHFCGSDNVVEKPTLIEYDNGEIEENYDTTEATCHKCGKEWLIV